LHLTEITWVKGGEGIQGLRPFQRSLSLVADLKKLGERMLMFWVLDLDTNISEKHTVSIFRVSTYESTQCYNPEENHLYSQDNLRSLKFIEV
jgi:ribosomal protein S3AE